MPLIPTRYDDKLDRLRDRIKQPGAQPQATRKFQRTRARQYLAQQRHRPETPPAYSSEYETTVGKLNRDLASAQSDITGREQAVEQQYGFNDQSNPFSRANLLHRNFQQQTLANTNSFAAQGQLYSGALSSAQGSTRYGYEQDNDAALRDYQAELSELARLRMGAQTTYDEGLLAAEAARLEAGLQDRPEPSEAPPTPGFVKKFKRWQRQNKRKN